LDLKVAVLLLRLLVSTITATPFDASISVVDASIFHPTTLITIPTALKTNFATSSIASFDHELKARKDDLEADNSGWFLNCAADHKLSLQYCEQRLHGYFCRLNEVNWEGKERNIMCEAACTCKKYHPVPGCFYVRGKCFSSQAEAKQFEQLPNDLAKKAAAAIDDLESTRFESLQARTENSVFHGELQEGGAPFSHSLRDAFKPVEQGSEHQVDDSPNPDLLPVLGSRDTEQALHDFAIVCIERDWTKICSGGPYKYSCDANGRISYRKLDLGCDAICGCVDLVAKPRCFRHGKWLTTCLSTLDDREVSVNESLSLQEDAKTIQDSSHGPGDLPMYCGLDGTADTSLTQFCSEQQYYCTLCLVDGHAKSFLRSNTHAVDQCTNNCQCAGSAIRSEFESYHAKQHIEERPDAEVEQSSTEDMSQSTGLSVFYCIKSPQVYQWDIDFRMIEFCQNENFICANDSPNDSPGFPPTVVVQSVGEKYPLCFDRCRCIHFENHNTVWRRSEANSLIGVE